MNNELKRYSSLIEEINSSPHLLLSIRSILKSIIKTFLHTALLHKRDFDVIFCAPNNQAFSAYSAAIQITMDRLKNKTLQMSFTDSIRKYNLSFKSVNVATISTFLISLFRSIYLYVLLRQSRKKLLVTYPFLFLIHFIDNCFSSIIRQSNFKYSLILMPTSTEGLILNNVCERNDIRVLNFDWGVADFKYPNFKHNQVLFIKSRLNDYQKTKTSVVFGNPIDNRSNKRISSLGALESLVVIDWGLTKNYKESQYFADLQALKVIIEEINRVCFKKVLKIIFKMRFDSFVQGQLIYQIFEGLDFEIDHKHGIGHLVQGCNKLFLHRWSTCQYEIIANNHPIIDIGSWLHQRQRDYFEGKIGYEIKSIDKLILDISSDRTELFLNDSADIEYDINKCANNLYEWLITNE